VSELRDVPAWQRFNRVRSLAGIPGGERMIDIQARFVGEILRRHEAQPEAEIAMVSHGDPLKAAVMYFLGMPLDHWDRFEIDLASVSVIAVGPHGAVVRRVNDELGPID
jgi:broad specificity phosphatase PhoE